MYKGHINLIEAMSGDTMQHSLSFRLAAKKFSSETRGQALVETAMFCVVVSLMLAMYINFAYVNYVGAGVTSASRQAAIYAAQGAKSITGGSLPAVSTACTVAANEVSGWLLIPSTQWSSYAASASLNGSTWSSTSSCAGNSYATAPVFKADPESTSFTINAISTNAALTPPVNFRLFGRASLSLPTTLYGRTFYFRQQN